MIQFRPHHVEIHANAPKERKPRCKRVDVQATRDAGPAVFQPVSNRVSHFQDSVCSSLLHMVATDADGVEFGHVL